MAIKDVAPTELGRPLVAGSLAKERASGRRCRAPILLGDSQKTVIRIIRINIITADISLEVKTARNGALSTITARTRCIKSCDGAVWAANKSVVNVVRIDVLASNQSP